MEQDKLKKYWDILQSAEAYLEGGWQPDRSDPPETLYRPGATTGGFDQIRERFSSADNQVPGSGAVADDSLEKIGAEVRNCRRLRSNPGAVQFC